MRFYLRFKDFKRKAVTLSYDDGVIWDRDLIAIMNKNSLKGTFNINTELYAQKTGERRLTKEEAYELYSTSGQEIAVHGAKHLHLADVEESVATRDVMVDRENLERTYGKIVKGMAYAYGNYSDSVVEMLKKCGIVYARTTVSTEKFTIPTDWLRLPATCHHRNPRLMELAKEFVEGEENYYQAVRPKLFYLWGHSYEFNDYNEWHIIEEFAEYIGNRDDIFYGTNMEIYNAVTDFNNLVFSADGTRVFNPSCREVYANYNGKDVLIPSGAEIVL